MDHKLSLLPTAKVPGKRALRHKTTPEAQQAAVQAAAAARAAADFIAQHELTRPRISFEGDVLHIHAYDMRGRQVFVRERMAPADPKRSQARVGASRKPEFPAGATVRAVPLEQFVDTNHLALAEPAESVGSRLSAADSSSANAMATDQALRCGHSYLLSLIADGSLLGSADLAQAWGVTPQALRRLVDANELVAIKVNNKLRFPVELARFDARSDAQCVSKCLAGLPAIEQVMFMLNEHAELGDKTASEAFHAGLGAKVLAMANRVAEVE